MKTIIVADDLTGANDTSAVLAKNGMRVATLDDLSNVSAYKSFDALAFHTDSRGIAQEDAYQIVHDTTKIAANVDVGAKFFSKRCDSTLRGNVGAEIDGMLDALPKDTIAMMAPAFPGSQKIVIGNYMLVNGTPLENTDVRNDPTSPVTTSRVAAIVRQQSKNSVAVISMEIILEGADAIESNIKVLVANGAKIIIFDTCTDDDLHQIAMAVVATNLPFITVDPGAFTNAVAMELTPSEPVKAKQKALFLIGTVSGIVVDQLADLKATYDPLMVKINSEALLDDDKEEKEIQHVVNEVLSNIKDNQIFVVATMIERSDKIDLLATANNIGISVKEASERICEAVASIGDQILEAAQDQIGGVYTSGSDISKAFLAQIKANGIEIKDEIIPLAVYGRVIGGMLDKKPIVTKGGLIGDKKTLSQCADYLTTKISNSFYEESKLP
ncbi:MAG: four-carbon acid sugar kinase family protein [Sporolactobacillus sp.]